MTARRLRIVLDINIKKTVEKSSFSLARATGFYYTYR